MLAARGIRSMCLPNRSSKQRPLRLKLLRDDGWVDTPGPATRLEVQVKAPAVKHEVTVQQIQRWLEGASISPNEMVKKAKLKSMLAQT
jgi:hypothetical protein